MKKQSVINWEAIELNARAYTRTKDEFERDVLVRKIFNEAQRYIATCVHNAYINSQNQGIYIPKEDFESTMNFYIWQGLESFDSEGPYPFAAILKRRISFTEKDVARSYRHIGRKDDKDGYTYESA